MLVALLKRRSVGYHAKKSKIFTKEIMDTFLKEADDKTFLLAKVFSINVNILSTNRFFRSL